MELDQGAGEPEDQAVEDALEIARLSRLPPLEYDRLRVEAAKKLGIRASSLDAQIRAYRGRVGAVRTELDGFDLTEDGIALAFATAHKEQLRFDHSRGKWFFWSGVNWQEDETKLAFSWCRRICRDMAALQKNDEKLFSTLSKANTAAAVERFAQADQVFAVTSAIWDPDLYLLGTPGGTVNLYTGEMREGRPEEHITRLTAVAPAQMPDCPMWLAFLEQVTNNDSALIRFLRQWCGYCLTGDVSEQALVFAYGSGGNGKGVFLNTVAKILGQYAKTAAMESFTSSDQDKHPTDLAMLRGARLVTASETEEGRAWAEKRIKILTGSDPISARFMRQDFFEFLPQFKLTIIGNHKPVIRTVDDAMRRRINMVPFVFKPANVDRELEAKLVAEWPAILRWMIEGCLDWQKNRLVRPEAVITTTNEYFSEQDLIGKWIEDCCALGNDKSETTAALFKNWTDYAAANGEKANNTKWLGQTLTRMGFRPTQTIPGERGKRGYDGIAVLRKAPRAWQEADDEWN